MNLDFTNKKILVTGGTKGIGKCLVENFRELGGKVWYTGRQPQNNDPGYVQVDFLNNLDFKKFISIIENIEFDIVVNNAGTNKIGPIEDYSVEDYSDILDLNLKSCFVIMKTVIPGMKKRGYGRLVNITSISSEISMPLRSAYCSSKFGLVGLTKAASVECAKHGVLINSVGPGVTTTKLTIDVLGDKKMKEISEKIPIGRLATVEDISPVVMFMCSNLNTYMVGQNVIVDGGFICV